MRGWPETDGATLQAVGASLHSRRWAVASPAGPWPRRIGLAEVALARLFQRDHVVCVANGSAAILLALQALGIGPQSRVLLPALTWIGCLTAVLRLGATPVLADCRADRLIADFVPQITGDIDAIVAIPLYAQIVDVEAIKRAFPARPLVLDLSHVSCSSAQARSGSSADIVVSSLQASKVLTCGEGGFAATNDRDLAHRMESLRTDGRVFNDDPTLGDATLTPGWTGHGANYAMSEMTAALLLDQLGRLDEQSLRRRAGVEVLSELLTGAGIRHHGDLDCLSSGQFYGLPLKVDAEPASVIEKVARETGVELDRCYPPLPEGPLFAPALEPRYRSIAWTAIDAPNARKWRESTIIVPHHALLLPHDRLTALVDALEKKRRAPRAPRGEAPGVTVVVVTNGARASLGAALASVAHQTYSGSIQVLLVLDGWDGPEPGHDDLAFRKVRIDLDARTPVIERVARMRDMALRLCDTPLVCFLDDDNTWDHDHLGSLQQKMCEAGVAAVHSWRRIRASPRFAGERFPWLPEGSDRERKQLAVSARMGVIVPGSDVVCDAAFAECSDGDASMVDMGAWLFESAVLKMFGLSACAPGTATPVEGVGEDDILLRQLKAAAIPIACTNRATLHYSLGGFSNNPVSIPHWTSP